VILITELIDNNSEAALLTYTSMTHRWAGV